MSIKKYSLSEYLLTIRFDTFHDLFVVLNDEGDTCCSQETHKGLSGLVKLLLGLPLDKKEQFSDWQKRPLRTSQLIYAGILSYDDLNMLSFKQYF